MNTTPRANRFHIIVLGRRNVGKSSLINSIAGQKVSIVSDVAGTTTDPVQKAMEILPLGPVLFVDTAGIDDIGELGLLRVEKSFSELSKADMVLLVLNDSLAVEDYEEKILLEAKRLNLPLIVVINKIDENSYTKEQIQIVVEKLKDIPVLSVSSLTGVGIDELKEAMVEYAPVDFNDVPIVHDLLTKGDTVVLVTPIDSAAPKGRMILPQVQVIRDVLDGDCSLIVTKETELLEVLENLKLPPKMVITDSQVFGYVNSVLAKEIALTSFSILFARYKGNLATLVQGAKSISNLKPGDKVLMSEACTHHRQEDDIGTVKIPNWLNSHVGGQLDFNFTAGNDFASDLSQYKLIVHCGSCMINRKEMLTRIMKAKNAGIPIVNYGVAIAYMHGILKRVLSPFPELAKVLENGV